MVYTNILTNFPTKTQRGFSPFLLGIFPQFNHSPFTGAYDNLHLMYPKEKMHYMLSYNNYSENGKRKRSSMQDNQFWDKLIRILFVLGVVIILIAIAIKWLGFLD